MSDALESARGVCKRMIDAHEKIMGDRLSPPLANAQRSSRLAFEAQQKAAKAIDAARAKAVNDMAVIKVAIRGPKVGDKHAPEFRFRLTQLDDKARNALLAEAVAQGDDEMVGAVLNSPSPLLVGMSKVEVESVRHNWQRRHHADKVDRYARLEKAVAALDRAGVAMIGFLHTLTPVSEIEHAERLQKQAQEAADRVA
jgi:hypothetical protein